MRPIFRTPLLYQYARRAFALFCLTVTVAQGEPSTPRVTSPRVGSLPPSLAVSEQELATTTLEKQESEKIFLFKPPPISKVRKPNPGTTSRPKKESTPSPSLQEDPIIAAPNKQESVEIFLFNDTPAENVKNQEPASAITPNKGLVSPFNQATDKNHSGLINTAPVSMPTTESAKENINSENTSDFYFTDGPPEGFEYLTSAQTTEIDIYFGNELLISTMARFDLTSVEFINPQEIIAQLTQLKEPEAIALAISGSLNPHTEDLCLNKLQHNCGVLKPSIADIIFDADRYRADLFINPLHLKTQVAHSRMFLPSPENNLSSVNIFSARASGGGNLEQRSYLSSNSIISYGATRLLTQTRLDNTDGLILDTARLEHDQKKWSYAAGTMESTSYISSLASTQSFLGLRAARTLNTRTDLRLSRGNSIFIFFNERSHVEILRDGKVLDSGFYEPGNQQLDTSNLPDGVYDINLRITNSRGEKLQTHLFSRSSLLPPQDHALHFLETGMFLEKDNLNNTNKTPKASDVSFVHAGTRMRINKNFGAEIEALNTSKNTALMQAGLYYFLPGLFLHGGALEGNEQTQGKFFNASFSHRQFSLNLNYCNLETNQQVETNPSFQTGATTALIQTETDPSFQTGTTTGLILGAHILGGSLLARATNTRSDNANKTVNTKYALSFRRPLFKRGQTRAYLTLDWKSNQGDDTMLMGLQLSGGSNTHSKSLVTRWSDSGDDSSLQTNGRFTRFHRYNGELYGSTTVSALTEKDQQNIGLRFKGDSRYGNGFFETQHQRTTNSNNTTYSAGAQAVVITGASAVALGGSKPGRAGLIIDLNGQSNEDFEVRVNNHKRATTTRNRNQPVLLPPYSSYEVTLKSKGDSLVHFDAKPQSVTLYPGNVTHLRWDVDPVFVVIGQAIYADGRAIENTRITNLDEFSGTDENGWFQVELSKIKTLELTPADGPACNIKLPEQTEYEEVIVFDQLVCSPLTRTTAARK
jgi:hypothetical protein